VGDRRRPEETTNNGEREDTCVSTSDMGHGEIVSRLPDLLRLAGFRWRQKITPAMVAEATGLDPKTVRLPARQGAKDQQGPRDIYYDTVRLLCWYFGTRTNDALVWIPPRHGCLTPPPPLDDGAVSRTRPPSGSAPATQQLPLDIRIGALLEGLKRQEIARATGLSYRTVCNLLNPGQPHTHIRGDTLAALCDFLSREHSRMVQPGELLSCDLREVATREEQRVV
jgi:DNA-binding Xre family transcriptional regulator